MKNPWKKLSSRVVLDNPWFRVKLDEVIRPDGSKSDYFYVDLPSSVFIVALNSDNEVYLIGQFRYPTQMFSWEVPGGNSDGQDSLDAAKRELKEETGLEASDWVSLGQFQSMNGICNEIGYVFLAKDVTQTKDDERSSLADKQGEEGIIKIKRVPFKKILNLIKSGEITDSQAISALTQAGLYLNLI